MKTKKPTPRSLQAPVQYQDFHVLQKKTLALIDIAHGRLIEVSIAVIIVVGSYLYK